MDWMQVIETALTVLCFGMVGWLIGFTQGVNRTHDQIAKDRALSAVKKGQE